MFDTLFLEYAKLCQYCDSFFDRVRTKHAQDMECGKGCFECCKLETVCALEAFILARSIHYTQNEGRLGRVNPPRVETYCSLLKGGACEIYAHRPVICRTHGLPITLETYTKPDSCPLNFTETDLSDLPHEDVLDTGMVTMNLMKLNLAFCTILGDASLADKRIPVVDLIEGRLPKALADLVSSPGD